MRTSKQASNGEHGDFYGWGVDLDHHDSQKALRLQTSNGVQTSKTARKPFAAAPGQPKSLIEQYQA